LAVDAESLGRNTSSRVPSTTPFFAKEPSQHLGYWERSVPWNFKGEQVPYLERRRLRYALQDYMAEVIPFASFDGKRLLEIGSGSGIDSAEFAVNGALVVSLDFTDTGARSTRDTLAEAGATSSDVVRAGAQFLPFRDGVFDCVYSFGVLHHIPDVKQVLNQVSKKLVEGGELILMLYNKESLLYYYSILFLHGKTGLTEDDLVSRYSERVEGCPYTKAYTTREVNALLAKDFHGISVGTHFDVVDTPERRKVKLNLSSDLKLGWHLIVRARKT